MVFWCVTKCIKYFGHKLMIKHVNASVFALKHVCHPCDWPCRQIFAALFYTQPLSCWAQRGFLRPSRLNTRRTGAPTADRHGSPLVYCLAASTLSEDLLLWWREPVSKRAVLNVSPSSCSRTAQNICFLYYVLLGHSLSVTIFLRTFYPVLWKTVLLLQTGAANLGPGVVRWLYRKID